MNLKYMLGNEEWKSCEKSLPSPSGASHLQPNSIAIVFNFVKFENDNFESTKVSEIEFDCDHRLSDIAKEYFRFMLSEKVVTS